MGLLGELPYIIIASVIVAIYFERKLGDMF